MKIVNITTFRKFLLGNKHNIAAIDMGTSNCGFAIADETKMSVVPGGTIERGSPRMNEDVLQQFGLKIQKFVADNKIAGFVIGLPLTPTGEITPFCEEIIQIAETVQCSCNGFANITSPVNPNNEVLCTFWDERYSTAGAKAISSKFSRRRSVMLKNKDTLAACLILKSFINQ